MRIKILGSGAAEGLPALFCRCEHCRAAQLLKGKNLRSRSSVSIDNVMQIDLPPDFLAQAQREGIDTGEIRSLLISHSHYDHFAPGDLQWLHPKFARRFSRGSLNVYASAGVVAKIRVAVGEGADLNLHELVAFADVRVGDYSVLPIPANHGVDNPPFNFLICDGRHSLLYACDTGPYPEATWQGLRDRKACAFIVECTGGKERRAEQSPHLGLPNVIDFRQRAVASALAEPSALWVLTHFSHHSGLLHSDLDELGKRHGFVVAFDGLTFEL